MRKYFGWREGRKRLLLILGWGSYWHEMLSWMWRQALCVGAACVSPMIFVPFFLEASKPSVSKAKLLIFSQSCPCFWAAHLNQRQLCVCILFKPKHSTSSFPHPSSSSPLSNQSPCFVNSSSLISLTSNYLTLFPWPLPKLSAFWATSNCSRKLHLSPFADFYAYVSFCPSSILS